MSTFSISSPAAALRVRARSLQRPELLALLALASLLDVWALSRNGFANTYYSGAIRSMTQSWHAFLYGSFDPSGVMTLDKPPLAFWIQAASAKLFGFNSWALLLPQALMGVATVALVYDLTRRVFGRRAGFVAGLVLALTPITVAISRHNNPDALLVLCITAALWALVRGLEDGRTRWIVLSGVCVGLGFEAKMGAALLVVPALAAAWLWVAPRGRAAALRQLLAAGTALAVAALAWPVLVWLTPAADRPWISGTSDNSIWSLIFGYNGFGRLAGQSGGPAGGGGPFGGQPGLLRLLNESLGGQAGWLVGFATVSAIAVIAATRLRRRDPRTGWIIAAGGSFAITALAFSTASGIFHPYYVSALAPFTAALAGAGIATLAGRASRLLAPLAIAAGIAAEVAILRENPGELQWVPALLVPVGAGAMFVLGTSVDRRLRAAALAAALGALLIAPATWSFQTLGHATSATFPAGGPATAAFAAGPGGGPPALAGGRPGFGRGFAGPGAPPSTGAPPAGALAAPPVAGGPALGGGPSSGGAFGGGPPTGGAFGGGDTQSLAAAVRYANAHGGGTVAVASQTGAAAELTATGAKVAGLGGFSGRESQVSVSWLADAVASGKVRWALTGMGAGPPRDGRIGATDLMAVVKRVGTKVSAVSGLYDLQGKAGALRAATG